MEIELASEMGFCFGVRRAIEMVEKAVGGSGSLQTLGPIVHNQQVVDSLEAMGITVAGDISHISGDTVAIASHGISPRLIGELESRGLRVVDATCPIVRRAQLEAKELSDAGFYVLIYGDAAHSEVQGLLGWAGERAIATLSIPEGKGLPHRIGILSQTTQNPTHFAHFVGELVATGLTSLSELRIVNTICKATKRRQDAASELAKRVDLMLVIGGRHSANTGHLAQVCAAAGVETHHIEGAAELEQDWFTGRHRIGVTAGASTPDEAINEVALRLKEMV